MWAASRVGSSYSVMDMGYLDYGGGPSPSPGLQQHGSSMQHGSPGTPSMRSVADLTETSNRPADVRVDLTARQETSPSATRPCPDTA